MTQSWSGFKVPRALPQGWTPMVWEQNMRRQTGELLMFSRCCAWIRDVRDIDVRLCVEPLYGRTLPEVACPPVDKSAEKPVEAASSRYPSFSADFPQRKPEGRPLSVPDKPVKREKGTTPLQLERKASREKLLHSAGGMKAPTGKNVAATPVMPEPGKKRLPTPAMTSGTDQDDWLCRLSERVGRSIGQIAGGSKGQTEITPSWKRPLSGTTVSRDVLIDLVNGSQPKADKPKIDVKPVLPPDSPMPERPPVNLPEAAAETAPAAKGTTEVEALRKAIDPPISVPSLMALLTPQRAYQPPPAAAATSIEAGAKKEAVETNPPDLSILAAQIKRILDEEARRHGIPV